MGRIGHGEQVLNFSAVVGKRVALFYLVRMPEGMVWESDALEALRAAPVARLPIDADGVLLTGLSMGGYGTWNCAVD